MEGVSKAFDKLGQGAANMTASARNLHQEERETTHDAMQAQHFLDSRVDRLYAQNERLKKQNLEDTSAKLFGDTVQSVIDSSINNDYLQTHSGIARLDNEIRINSESYLNYMRSQDPYKQAQWKNYNDIINQQRPDLAPLFYPVDPDKLNDPNSNATYSVLTPGTKDRNGNTINYPTFRQGADLLRSPINGVNYAAQLNNTTSDSGKQRQFFAQLEIVGAPYSTEAMGKVDSNGIYVADPRINISTYTTNLEILKQSSSAIAQSEAQIHAIAHKNNEPYEVAKARINSVYIDTRHLGKTLSDTLKKERLDNHYLDVYGPQETQEGPREKQPDTLIQRTRSMLSPNDQDSPEVKIASLLYNPETREDLRRYQANLGLLPQEMPSLIADPVFQDLNILRNEKATIRLPSGSPDNLKLIGFSLAGLMGEGKSQEEAETIVGQNFTDTQGTAKLTMTKLDLLHLAFSGESWISPDIHNQAVRATAGTPARAAFINAATVGKIIANNAAIITGQFATPTPPAQTDAAVREGLWSTMGTIYGDTLDRQSNMLSYPLTQTARKVASNLERDIGIATYPWKKTAEDIQDKLGLEIPNMADLYPTTYPLINTRVENLKQDVGVANSVASIISKPIQRDIGIAKKSIDLSGDIVKKRLGIGSTSKE